MFGAASQTVAQHWANIISMYRFFWVSGPKRGTWQRVHSLTRTLGTYIRRTEKI